MGYSKLYACCNKIANIINKELTYKYENNLGPYLDYVDSNGLFTIKISTSSTVGSNKNKMYITSNLLKKFKNNKKKYIGVSDINFYSDNELLEVSKKYIRSNIKNAVEAYKQQTLIEETDLINLLNNIYVNLKKVYR